MSSALGFFNAGTQALNAGSLTTAVALLREAVSCEAGPVVKLSALRNLGIALRRTGDDAGALEAFESALSIDPLDVSARYSLGNTLFAMGQHQAAAETFQVVRSARPDFAQAANNEGAAWMALGRSDRAEACFSDAVRIDPSFAHALGNLGAVQAAMGRHAAPLHALQRALKLAPDDVGIRTKLGHLLTELGHFDAAIRTFSVLTQRHPPHPDAVAGLSLALHRRGDTVGALAAIAPSIARGTPHPDEAVAYARICLHMDRPQDAVVVLESALSAATQPATRVFLGKQLGQVLDAVGETDRAFSAIATANQIRDLRFNSTAHRAHIEAIIAGYDPEKVISDCEDETPVFIVGVPRSGTTLVEQMLDAHPSIFGAGERGELQMIAGCMAGKQLDEDALNRLSQTYLDRIRSLAPDALRITDKMPSNFMVLGEAARLFPHARVIHCVRDPADTGLSCLFQHFKDTLPWATRQADIASFVEDYRALMDHWAATNPMAMLTVPYEALVSRPEHWARRMSTFLGLPFDAAMLRPEENKRVVRTASFDQVRRPIHTQRIGIFQAYKAHIPRLIELRDQSELEQNFAEV